ncbi:MAG: hypothetical protein KGN34_15945 [Sphingomonadales bacterium]|nr:hypothetical protein [Sphingomonadales bacterium]
MTTNAENSRKLADDAAGLEHEREVSSTITSDARRLALARAALHEWVDSVVAVVATAGSGRVTLVHSDGTRSGIASADLAYRLTPPVRFD